MPNYNITVYGEDKKIDEFDQDFEDTVKAEDYTKSKYPGLAVIVTKN